MFNFKDIDALHSVLKAIYKSQPGPAGIALFSTLLQEEMKFTPEQAACYSKSVLTNNSERSADFVHRNAWKLVAKWSRGDPKGSAGNLVVSKTWSWIFSEQLSYESKYETYEGYTDPFGGGYSRPTSSSTSGIWAPSDLPTSPFSVVTISEDGRCASRTVEWTVQDQLLPSGMSYDGERFGRMNI
jgi:hypothetical protein